MSAGAKSALSDASNGCAASRTPPLAPPTATMGAAAHAASAVGHSERVTVRTIARARKS